MLQGEVLRRLHGMSCSEKDPKKLAIGTSAGIPFSSGNLPGYPVVLMDIQQEVR
jgi:hypothetical protein